MITITNLSKCYGKKTLFSNISLSIHRGERIGLIGPNGSGKSTLFLMILGEIEPTQGTIHIHKNVRIGYLPQELHFESPRTVLQEIIEGDKVISELNAEKCALEIQDKAQSGRYGEILHTLEALGFFELEYKAKEVLGGLGFKVRDFNRPINQMSGGFKMRVLLAKLLVCHYDVLLLDEPTNYLDLNATLWLKDYLAHFKGTFIIISHDKAFLNDTTYLSLILEAGTITKVRGHYEQYQRLKDQMRLYLEKQFREQEKRRKTLQRFIERFHAQPNKASQVRAKRTQLERMEPIVVPQDKRASIRTFKFPTAVQSGQRIITLQNISKSYGDIQVYRNFNLEITKGVRAVLVGENGAGKSTLLKILAGVLEVDCGQRLLGHNVSIGYFSQTRMDVLNPEETVLEEACSVARSPVSTETVRTILGLFLFSGEDVDKKVKVLSGGEKSRLILAKLLINPPNFLLLDEPTTHLDIDSVDALIKALTEYQGTLIFISHDIHFIRSVANCVFEVKNGQVRQFPGNFDYYLQKREQLSLPLKSEDGARLKPQGEQAKSADEKKSLSKDERRVHNALLSKKIKKLSKEKDRLLLERYSKQRIASNPRHGDDIVRYYLSLVEEIDERIKQIETQIEQFKSQFL